MAKTLEEWREEYVELESTLNGWNTDEDAALLGFLARDDEIREKDAEIKKLQNYIIMRDRRIKSLEGAFKNSHNKALEFDRELWVLQERIAKLEKVVEAARELTKYWAGCSIERPPFKGYAELNAAIKELEGE